MASSTSVRAGGWLWAGLRIVLLALYALVIAEGTVRIAKPQPRMPRNVTAAAWGVRGNIPNARYHHSTAEVDVDFAINGQGMRADRDFPEAKPVGTCRIALLGDSFMMGYELSLPDTFAARLEGALNAAGHKVEVLNFAVSGFGTAENLRTYEAYAQRFDPDLVVMEWDRSDYDDNIRSDLYRLDGGTLVATGNSFLPSVGLQEALARNPVYAWIAEHSDLYNFTRETLGLQVRDLSAQLSSLGVQFRGRLHPDATAAAPVAAARLPQPWAGDISPPSVALSAALLTEADRIVTGQGRGFLVVEIPYQYPPRHSVASLALMGADRLARLPIVSPVAAFNADEDAHKIYYVSGDGHITPYAVGLMLAPVLERLQADPHLAGCPAAPPAQGAVAP